MTYPFANLNVSYTYDVTNLEGMVNIDSIYTGALILVGTPTCSSIIIPETITHLILKFNNVPPRPIIIVNISRVRITVPDINSWNWIVTHIVNDVSKGSSSITWIFTKWS